MVRSQRKTVGGESMDNGCGNRREKQRVKGLGGEEKWNVRGWGAGRGWQGSGGREREAGQLNPFKRRGKWS